MCIRDRLSGEHVAFRRYSEFVRLDRTLRAAWGLPTHRALCSGGAGELPALPPKTASGRTRRARRSPRTGGARSSSGSTSSSTASRKACTTRRRGTPSANSSACRGRRCMRMRTDFTHPRKIWARRFGRRPCRRGRLLVRVRVLSCRAAAAAAPPAAQQPQPPAEQPLPPRGRRGRGRGRGGGRGGKADGQIDEPKFFVDE